VRRRVRGWEFVKPADLGSAEAGERFRVARGACLLGKRWTPGQTGRPAQGGGRPAQGGGRPTEGRVGAAEGRWRPAQGRVGAAERRGRQRETSSDGPKLTMFRIDVRRRLTAQIHHV